MAASARAFDNEVADRSLQASQARVSGVGVCTFVDPVESALLAGVLVAGFDGDLQDRVFFVSGTVMKVSEVATWCGVVRRVGQARTYSAS